METKIEFLLGNWENDWVFRCFGSAHILAKVGIREDHLGLHVAGLGDEVVVEEGLVAALGAGEAGAEEEGEDGLGVGVAGGGSGLDVGGGGVQSIQVTGGGGGDHGADARDIEGLAGLVS